ncbi:glycoside hydrolase domain-containing protein [candidate division KSB1 bacterium]
MEDSRKLETAAIKRGPNTFKIVVDKNRNPDAMGFRLYGVKNVEERDIHDGVPVMLTVHSGDGEQTSYSIPVWGEEGEHVESRWDLPAVAAFTEIKPEYDDTPLPVGPEDIQRGYVTFSRHWLRYVYPWTVPKISERIESLSVCLAANDFEPVTLSVYPLRDLGTVTVRSSDLTGPGSSVIPADKLQVHLVKTLKVAARGAQYRLVPRLLDRGDRAEIPLGRTTRFWITLRADRDVIPGTYRGRIDLTPQTGEPVSIPLQVNILPFSLEPHPGIAYSMFMSYEFYEMDGKDWTEDEKRKIYQNDLNIFRDYRDHGMTTVDVATPFYFQWNQDGSPRLEHLRSAMKAYKEAGFDCPMFWYLAHYLQAAKKQHPGNVANYDPKIHPRRAEKLVRAAEELVAEMDGPQLIYSPIDEPRIASRRKITLDLLKRIKRVKGVKTMSSTDIGGKLLDIENNSQRHKKSLGPGETVRNSEREVWEYNNGAVHSFNPGYSRYIYGLYVWRQDLDGMNSWVFQTTQNCRGNPFEDLDSPFGDVFFAYPHPDGPLPTPNWEAVREGIDDLRHLYLLERLIKSAGEDNPNAIAAEKFLEKLRGMCDIDDRRMVNNFGPWTPETFDQVRAEMIDWILKLKP